jgi:hypothetical protein
MNTLAVNVRTGRPVRWPRHPFTTGTDRAEFHCVWNGQHYRLASLSAHLKKKVPAGMNLLIDSRYQTKIVPQSEVHVRHRI